MQNIISFISSAPSLILIKRWIRGRGTTNNMEKEKRYSNFRGARVIQVIEVHVNEGEGVVGDATYREVYYTHLDGRFIAKTSNQPLRQFADDLPDNN